MYSRIGQTLYAIHIQGTTVPCDYWYVCITCIMCVLVLISTSTHTSSRCVILHMSVITQGGGSALMLAASEGKTESVVELVKAGANVDVQDKVC